MKTKSLDGVKIEALVKVQCYGSTKGRVKKPTRCAKVLDSVEGLKDHYWLQGFTHYGKGQKVKLLLTMWWVEGYGIRVKEWEYI